MSNILTVGFVTEGPTDQRFLETIIKRTFEEIAYECSGMIEVFDPMHLRMARGEDFVERLLAVSRTANKTGIQVLCVHCDADAPNDANVLAYKIQPLLDSLAKGGNDLCKNIVAILPVQMSEAWLLADTELFKEEVATKKSDDELGINKHPELFSDPKAVLQGALRIAQADFPKRRHKVALSELYQPIGQKISLEKLSALQSFLKFKHAVREAFIRLNYLQ